MVIGMIAAFIVVFCILSVLFFVLAQSSANRFNAKKKACTYKTTATIINIQKERISRSDDYNYTWYPTYEYYANGTRMEKKSNIGVGKNTFEKGQTVDLYFNPDNSDQVYVPSEKAESLVTVFRILGTAFGGVVLFSVAIVIFLWKKKVI